MWAAVVRGLQLVEVEQPLDSHWRGTRPCRLSVPEEFIIMVVTPRPSGSLLCETLHSVVVERKMEQVDLTEEVHICHSQNR